MDAELWQTLDRLFQEALSLPPDRQEHFVRSRSAGNSEIEGELRSLLDGHRRASFLDTSVGNLFLQFAADLDTETPQRIGPYTIVRTLGRGGMGAVYLGLHEKWNVEAAIKVPQGMWISPQHQFLFEAEQQSVARLIHTNIARIFEGKILDDGTPWFAMEYVDGEPITTYCARLRLDARDRLRLFLQVCDAVQYAHSKGVIHRDLKPSNILVNSEGKVKLLDFGIAKQVGDLALCSQDSVPNPFTRAYAAPEQIAGGEVSSETDIYSLGVVLHELIYVGSSEGLSKWEWADLRALIEKARHTDTGHRYRTVDGLANDIRRFLQYQPLDARNHSISYIATKFVRRNRAALAAAAAAILCVVGFVSFYTVRLEKARNAALKEAARADHTKDLLLRIVGGGFDTAPSATLRVVDVLDQAARQAQELSNEPDTQADIYETLGNLYNSLGEYGKSEQAAKMSIAKRRSVHGTDDVDFGETLISLSALRSEQAKFAEAEQLAREGVSIASRHLPIGHKLLGESYAGLGNPLMRDGLPGHLAESIQVLEKAVELQTGQRQEQSGLIAAEGYLGSAYMLAGRYADAEKMQRQVLEDDKRFDGDGSPGVAEDFSNLSEVLMRRGAYAEAERDERKALAMESAWYQKENAEVALVEAGLADALIRNGKLDEASRLLISAMPVFERETGRNHPFFAHGLDLEGTVALRRGDQAQAEKDFDEMAKIYTAVYGGKDRHNAIGPLRMGEVYLAKNEDSRAEASFRRATDLLTGSIGADHPETASARIELGDALFREHSFSEAHSELVRGYRDVTKDAYPSTIAAVKARKDLDAMTAASR